MWIASKCEVDPDFFDKDQTIGDLWLEVSANPLFVKAGNVKKFKLDWYILVKYDPTADEDSNGFKVPVCYFISGVPMVPSLTIGRPAILGSQMGLRYDHQRDRHNQQLPNQLRPPTQRGCASKEASYVLFPCHFENSYLTLIHRNFA